MIQLLHSMAHAVFSQQMLLILLAVYLMSFLLSVGPMAYVLIENIKMERHVSLGVVAVFLAYTLVPVLNTVLIFYAVCYVLSDRFEEVAGGLLDKLDRIVLFKLPGRKDDPLDRLRRSTGT